MKTMIPLFVFLTFWSASSFATVGSLLSDSESGALRIKLSGTEAMALKNLMAPENQWEIADLSDSSTFSEIDCSQDGFCYLTASGSIYDRSELNDGSLDGSDYKDIRRHLKKAKSHEVVVEAPPMGVEVFKSQAEVDLKLFTAIKNSKLGSLKTSTSDDKLLITTAKVNLGKLQIQCENFSHKDFPTTCYFTGIFADTTKK